MNTKPLLSFVIPMYNGRQYIGACIESILNQNLDKSLYEIIVIDDGSTDDGSSIVKQFSQIVYYRQMNQGQSVARNKGIELARGEYICFVDADDLLVENSLKYCLIVAVENDLDMVTYDLIRCTESQINKIVPSISDSMDEIISGDVYLGKYNYNNSPCLYLIKKQSLKDHRFVEGRFGEDGMFTLELLMRMKRIAHVNNQCYYYVLRPGSTTTRTDTVHLEKMISDYLFVYHHIQELIIKYKDILSTKAISRCKERSESYIFFLLIRLLKFPDPSIIKPTIERLKKEGVYPMNAPYNGFVYSVTSLVVNNYYLLRIANWMFSILKKSK